VDLLDLRSLQMMVESDNSIEHTRDVLTEAVSFFSNHENNSWKVELIFKELRDNLDMSSLDEKDIFLYDFDEFRFLDIPEEYTNYSLGLFNDEKHSRYSGRLVYPVRDVKGNVMGLCGWDPTDLPKYLDSNTYGYNAKNNCLYGMEKLPEYYKSDKLVFITEGIVCCNYLRSKEFQALALLGSSVSKYVIEILKRFGYRCVLLPDNDTAGLHIKTNAKYNLPKARCYVSTLAKDIDDTRKLEEGKYEQQLLTELRSLESPFVMTKILRVEK
jgi:hypothetical protein